ncbi:hypothetical protein ACJD0Z_00535 [Flavobacteriaceae bacterium M23B6Z8]
MEASNSQFINFLKALIPFTLALALAHYLVTTYLLPQFSFHYGIVAMYTFYVVATILVYLAVAYVYKTSKDRAGMAFMALGFFKMMAAVLFLWPVIANKEKSALPDVIAFFIPYFLYLIVETSFTIKILKSK